MDIIRGHFVEKENIEKFCMYVYKLLHLQVNLKYVLLCNHKVWYILILSYWNNNIKLSYNMSCHVWPNNKFREQESNLYIQDMTLMWRSGSYVSNWKKKKTKSGSLSLSQSSHGRPSTLIPSTPTPRPPITHSLCSFWETINFSQSEKERERERGVHVFLQKVSSS